MHIETGVAAFVAALVFSVLTLLNIYAPICSYSIADENLVLGVSIGVAVIAGNIFLFNAYFRKSRVNWACLILVFPFLVASVFTGRRRNFDLEQHYWDFEGIVSKKYLSSNHGARSIIVNDSDYEYIALEFWNTVREGDLVAKKVCDTFVYVHGRKVNAFD